MKNKVIKSYDKDLRLYFDMVKTLRNNPTVINPDLLLKDIAKRLNIKRVDMF